MFGEDKGKGVVVRARLAQEGPGGAFAYELAVTNASARVPLDGWMIQVGRWGRESG